MIGTRNALEASAQAGVRRFVHCGTEAALMAGEPLVNVDETAPRRPDSKALYSATKARAEEAVIAANRDGFETLSMRPRFVWGAGDTTLLPNILAMVKAGRFMWIDGGGHRTSITHVDNVVEGLMLAAERGRPGQVYFVTDGEPVVFREFLSELISSQGVEPPDRSVPAGRARGRPRGRGGLAGVAAEGGAAGHSLRVLGVRAGVHDRHLEGPARAGLRAAGLEGAGFGGAPRGSFSRLTPAPVLGGWPPAAEAPCGPLPRSRESRARMGSA